VLAHYLNPHDLGVMAIASIVLSWVPSRSDSASATRCQRRSSTDVRRRRVHDQQCNGRARDGDRHRRFEWIADLFNEPRVTGVLVAVSVILRSAVGADAERRADPGDAVP
jgi:hypothetical protein